MAQECDRLRPGYVTLYALGRPRGVDVKGGRLADRLFVFHPSEKRTVLLDVGEPRGLPAPPELAFYDLASGVQLVVEEERLLDGAHVDLGVLVEVVVQRGRPRLLSAQYEEVGHCHPVTSPTIPRKNALCHKSRCYPRNTAGLGCHPSLALSIRTHGTGRGMFVIGACAYTGYVRVRSWEYSTAGELAGVA